MYDSGTKRKYNEVLVEKLIFWEKIKI